MSEVTMGNLYDINKQIMTQAPCMSEEDIDKAVSMAASFIDDMDNKYYMLLCNERKDYTLFNLESGDSDGHWFAAEDLIVCLSNRGDILSIDLTENKDAIECWIKIDDEAFCYYFFPYDKGVLEY